MENTKEIYIVEDYNSGDFYGFKSVEGARLFMLKHFADHLTDWYGNGAKLFDFDEVAGTIARELKGLLDTDYPYIEDVMYSRKVTIMD